MSACEISPDVLTGGEWVNVRGVMRWVPQPAPAVLTLVPELEAAPERDWMSMIACPTCKAKLAEPCRTKDGRARHSHAVRLIPRRCVCGGVPLPRKFYCLFCRTEKRAESRERYESKRRGEVA